MSLHSLLLGLGTLLVLCIITTTPDVYTSRAVLSYLLCRSVLSVFSSLIELIYDYALNGCELCGRRS
uniref:Uncharacterized protein n=1 Tax=Rose leaf rosette-associated virus TaxID=1543207 RepID=A0A7U1BMQ4_9CLOS|nr:hypothetical protein p7b [Rose leaf rosette-associated virus]